MADRPQKEHHALKNKIQVWQDAVAQVKSLEADKNRLEKEIGEIVYLVRNHSQHDNIEEFNRKMVMDADGCSMIDWEVVPPTLDKKGSHEFLSKYFSKERSRDRWNTKTGKKFLKQLLKKAENYWD